MRRDGHDARRACQLGRGSDRLHSALLQAASRQPHRVYGVAAVGDGAEGGGRDRSAEDVRLHLGRAARGDVHGHDRSPRPDDRFRLQLHAACGRSGAAGRARDHGGPRGRLGPHRGSRQISPRQRPSLGHLSERRHDPGRGRADPERFERGACLASRGRRLVERLFARGRGFLREGSRLRFQRVQRHGLALDQLERHDVRQHGAADAEGEQPDEHVLGVRLRVDEGSGCGGRRRQQREHRHRVRDQRHGRERPAARHEGPQDAGRGEQRQQELLPQGGRRGGRDDDRLHGGHADQHLLQLGLGDPELRHAHGPRGRAEPAGREALLQRRGEHDDAHARRGRGLPDDEGDGDGGAERAVHRRRHGDARREVHRRDGRGPGRQRLHFALDDGRHGELEPAGRPGDDPGGQHDGDAVSPRAGRQLADEGRHHPVGRVDRRRGRPLCDGRAGDAVDQPDDAEDREPGERGRVRGRAHGRIVPPRGFPHRRYVREPPQGHDRGLHGLLQAHVRGGRRRREVPVGDVHERDRRHGEGHGERARPQARQGGHGDGDDVPPGSGRNEDGDGGLRDVHGRGHPVAAGDGAGDERPQRRRDGERGRDAPGQVLPERRQLGGRQPLRVPRPGGRGDVEQRGRLHRARDERHDGRRNPERRVGLPALRDAEVQGRLGDRRADDVQRVPERGQDARRAGLCDLSRLRLQGVRRLRGRLADGVRRQRDPDRRARAA